LTSLDRILRCGISAFAPHGDHQGDQSASGGAGDAEALAVNAELAGTMADKPHGSRGVVTKSGTWNAGELPWMTAKIVYPCVKSGEIRRSKLGCNVCSRFDFTLLLTTQTTPSPFGLAGVKTSIVRAKPNLRP
jgi:hypothetical protein